MAAGVERFEAVNEPAVVNLAVTARIPGRHLKRHRIRTKIERFERNIDVMIADVIEVNMVDHPLCGRGADIKKERDKTGCQNAERSGKPERRSIHLITIGALQTPQTSRIAGDALTMIHSSSKAHGEARLIKEERLKGYATLTENG